MSEATKEVCVPARKPLGGMAWLNSRVMAAIESLPEEPTPVQRLSEEERKALAEKLTLAADNRIVITYMPNQKFAGAGRGCAFDIDLPYAMVDGQISLPAGCCVNAEQFGGDLAAAVCHVIQSVADLHQDLAYQVEMLLDDYRLRVPRK